MAINILVNFKMVLKMEKDNIYIIMVIYMMDFGQMVKWKEKEAFFIQMEISMKVKEKMEIKKDLVHILFRKEEDIQEIGKME